jgi:hypothetical protein
MRTTLKGKIIIDAPKYSGFANVPEDKTGIEEITLNKIKEEITKGHYILEWINSELSNDTEPTLIIKI